METVNLAGSSEGVYTGMSASGVGVVQHLPTIETGG